MIEAEGQFVFTECNANDLAHLGKQLAGELPALSISRTLIEDLDAARLRQNNVGGSRADYHFAEVKEIVGKVCVHRPVHLHQARKRWRGVTIRPGSKVLVVGHNNAGHAAVGHGGGLLDAKIRSSPKTKWRNWRSLRHRWTRCLRCGRLRMRPRRCRSEARDCGAIRAGYLARKQLKIAERVASD